MKGKGAEGGEGDDEYADLANFEDPSIAEHDEVRRCRLCFYHAVAGLPCTAAAASTRVACRRSKA
eukprot:3909-Eustigmatos_ZCMA.PRE.1